MSIVYSVSMNKGGVGKTSLVTNLAGTISATYPDKKILIIDTDGQGNSAIAFNKNPVNFDYTIYDVFMGNKTIDDVKVSLTENLDLVPANSEMNYLEFDILTDFKQYKNPFELLMKEVEKAKKKYDYIIFDTPPSMGLVAGNVLNVSDRVIIPFVPEMFAVQGLIRVIESIKDFKAKNNPNLELFGVVGMMVDNRTILHSEMLQNARKYCLENNIRMFETIIPKSIRFANAVAYEGKPAVWSDSNPIVLSYKELLEEVMEYVKEKTNSN